MLKQPIFLSPVFQERIWGGTALRDQFGYDIPNERTGECWAISAHPNGPNVVREGEFEGKTLADLWNDHRELFGDYKGDQFPLLTKILDANKDLSVQVHPNDEYANINENGELGKTECWYVIDCKENAEIVYGHHAQSKEEFIQMVEEEQWDKLLRRVKIKPGDFFYVPSGTIHAICEGTLILETQQSSDTTYRVYDYDRKDKNGHTRELHLEKAIDVTTAPHVDQGSKPSITEKEDLKTTTYVKDQYFSVYKWNINGKAALSQHQPFMLVSVLEGNGTLENGEHSSKLKKGDHFILPANFGEFIINGQIECIVSHP